VHGSLVLWRQFALRHLRERRLRAALTLGGVALGVALVLAVSAVSTTLVESARASARDIAGLALLEVSATDPHGMGLDVVREVGAVEGVEQAAPVLRANTRLHGSDAGVRTQVLGVTPELSEVFSDREGDPTHLRFDGDLSTPGEAMVLSVGLRDRLGSADVTDLRVDTPGGIVAVEVVGEVEGPALSAVNGGEFGVMALDTAQRVFQRDGRIDSVYVTAASGVDEATLTARIDDAVGDRAEVGVPGDRMEAFEAGFAPLIAIVALGSGVGLVVAVFIVFNTMGIAVAERRREISTALLLGARHRQVAVALVAEAALLGLAGSALGALAGVGIAGVLVEPVLDAYAFVFPDTVSGSLTLTVADIALPVAGGVAVAIAGALSAVRRIRDVAPIDVLRPQPAGDPDGTPGRRVGLLTGRSLVAALLVTLGVAGLALYAVSGADALAPASLALALAGVTVAGLTAIPVVVARLGSVLVRVFGVRGRLASAALSQYPRRTTFTVASLMLPAAMAIAIGAAIFSYEQQAQEAAYAWHGVPLKVSSDSYALFGSDQPLDGALADDLRDIPGVERVYPERELLLTLAGEPIAINAMPIADSLGDQPEPWISPLRADETDLVEGLADGQVVISSFAAGNHGLGAGDELTLPTPDGRRTFTIAGVYPDLTTFQALFMEYEHFREVWDEPTVDEFSLVLAGDARVDEVTARIETLIAERELPAVVQTRDEKVSSIMETVEGLAALARAIQFSALAAAALAVGNTLFTSVHDRRWQLALGRLIGMRGKDVGGSVSIEAGSVGLVGGVAGALLGVPLGAAMLAILRMRFSWEIGFRTPWAVVGTILVLGIVIAVLAAAYPRRTATRIPITEALRAE
jgi:putative ABC transport system permease protein